MLSGKDVSGGQRKGPEGGIGARLSPEGQMGRQAEVQDRLTHMGCVLQGPLGCAVEAAGGVEEGWAEWRLSRCPSLGEGGLGRGAHGLGSVAGATFSTQP